MIVGLILACLMGGLGAWAQSPDAPVEGTITATRLNVRARPGTQYEVVCQLLRDAKVQVVARNDEWVGIVAPAETRAFVPNRALDGDTINTDNTRIYAGPGAVFSDFNRVHKGERIVIRRRQDDKWTQVEPPPGSVVWVHSRFVEMPEPEAEVVTVTDEPPEPGVQYYPDTEALAQVDDTARGGPSDVPAEEAPPAPREPPPLYRIEGLPKAASRETLRPIGTPVDFTGTAVVIPLTEEHRPFVYALAVEIDAVFYPLVYLRGTDAVDLQAVAWQEVEVSGQRRWLENWPRPMVDVAALRPTAQLN